MRVSLQPNHSHGRRRTHTHHNSNETAPHLSEFTVQLMLEQHHAV